MVRYFISVLSLQIGPDLIELNSWVPLDSAVSAIVGSRNEAARAARLDFQMHIARRFQIGRPSPLFLERRNRTLLLPLIASYLTNKSVASALLFLKHIIVQISSQVCCCFGRSRLPSNYVAISAKLCCYFCCYF